MRTLDAADIAAPERCRCEALGASVRGISTDRGDSPADTHAREKGPAGYFLAIRPSTILLKSVVPNDTYSARFA